MNNEPVAIRYDFDGYGYQYIDSGSGSDWQTRVQGEPLYTAPHPEQYPQIAISPEIVGYVAPQRKPLTDEQRFDLLTKFEPYKNKWGAPAILIDMVEAAHGIKDKNTQKTTGDNHSIQD